MGVLVVASGQSSPLLQAVEAALDDVAAPVDRCVEGTGAPAVRAAGGAVGQLVVAFGDRDGGASSGQVAAVGAGAAALVADHLLWAGSGTAPALAGDVDLLDQSGQHGRVVDVACRQHDRQWPTVAVDGQVGLGGRSAAGAADRDQPVQLPGGIGVRLCRFQQSLPRPVRGPARQAGTGGLPRPEPLRQLPPRGAGAVLPGHRFDHLSVAAPAPTPTRRHRRQQRLDPSPRRIREHLRRTHDQQWTSPPL